MQTLSLPRILSLTKVLTVAKPQETVKADLVRLLKTRLKQIGIVWGPEAFAAGLSNPDLPKYLLNKLENLVYLAEASNWRLSSAAISELDGTVEDIETFNPAFRKRLIKEIAKAKKENKNNQTLSVKQLEKDLKIKLN